ncbi:hypothetical protein GH714_002269 [Hevea brasiliensis]|uniref:Uncharacterized protein n=1 Tax=Hevea brasiliensis TaxID=3981 RepID=A0A6A6KRN3_HEVBR|nr:hypothetical protein GH714_002269 [Hevea brasiliensis]
MQERKVLVESPLDMYLGHLFTQDAAAEAREGTDSGALLATNGGDYTTFVERFIVRRLVANRAPEDPIHPNLLTLFVEPLRTTHNRGKKMMGASRSVASVALGDLYSR